MWITLPDNRVIITMCYWGHFWDSLLSAPSWTWIYSRSVCMSACRSFCNIKSRCLAHALCPACGVTKKLKRVSIHCLFSQHALRVPSSRPRVPACASSALQTAARRRRLPPSACAATATTAATPISQMSPAQVSVMDLTYMHSRSDTLTLVAVGMVLHLCCQEVSGSITQEVSLNKFPYGDKVLQKQLKCQEYWIHQWFGSWPTGGLHKIWVVK